MTHTDTPTHTQENSEEPGGLQSMTHTLTLSPWVHD